MKNDRETGLPELLATLRAARSMLANLDDREFFSVEAAKVAADVNAKG